MMRTPPAAPERFTRAGMGKGPGGRRRALAAPPGAWNTAAGTGLRGFVCALLVLLGWGAPAPAQVQAEVRGRVSDAWSGAPVADARVEVLGSGLATHSGAGGDFLLRGLLPGPRELVVAAPGYRTRRATVDAENGRTAWLAVALEPSVVQLPELTATAPQPAEAGALVLGRDAIRASGARELGELLQGQAGIVVTRRGGPGTPAEISIRGSSADQVLVLVDGIAINSLLTGEADLSTVPLEGVQRVTVLRGAQAARYGARALAGVVVVQTRRPAAEAEARLGAGAWGERAVAGSMGGQTTRGAVAAGGLLAGEWRASQGGFPFAVPAVRGGGVAERLNADASSLNLLGSGTLTRGDTEVHARAEALRVRRGMPGSVVQPALHARQQQQRVSGGAVLRHQAGHIAWATGVDAQRQTARYHDSVPPFGAAFDNQIVVSGVGATASAEVLHDAWQWSTGLEARQTHFRTDLLAAGAPDAQQTAAAWADVRANRTRRRWTGSAFATLRLDHHSLLAAPVLSPRIGASAARGNIALRISGGSAFAPPSLADQFFQEGVQVRPNPDLQPERVRAELEVAAEARNLPLGTARLDVEAAAFRADVHGMILWFPDYRFVWQPSNFDVQRRGAEFTARARWRGAEFTGGAALTAAEYASAAFGGQVIYRPRWTAHAGAAARWFGTHATLSARWVGERRTVPGSPLNSLSPYWVADLSAARPWSFDAWRVEGTGTVENLFDRDAAMLIDYPYPGRTWRFGVRVGREPRRPAAGTIPAELPANQGELR